MLRSLALVAISLTVLIGFSFVNPGAKTLDEALRNFERAAAQGAVVDAPTETVTPTSVLPSAPTPEPVSATANAGSSVPDVPTAILDLGPVATATAPTSTPVAPAPTLTDTPSTASVAPSLPRTAAAGTPFPTATPEAMPTLDVSLPKIPDYMDVSGAVVEATVAKAGGNIRSADGRVSIDIPPGAFSENLSVKVTTRGTNEVLPPWPDAPIVGLWVFDAAAIDRGFGPVHKFESDLKVTVHFGANDLNGRDPRNLRFWTRPDDTSKWEAVPAAVNPADGLIVAHMDHFSETAITASRIVDASPLLDGRNVDLHSGAASMSIPISLPPARGGLVPQLNLNYNSGRLGEMKGYTSLGGWVGTGWALDVPNIQFSQDPLYSPDNYHTRAFLSLNGLGGEMMPDPFNPYVWRLRDENYFKISTSCNAPDCGAWTVVDKQGTQYVFGSGNTNEQWERFYTGAPLNGVSARRIYRADIRYIQDVFGNRIDFSYWQYRVQGPYGQDVMAAYPLSISYDGGAVSVNFSQGCDENIASPAACVRYDSPRDTHDATCPVYLQDWKAPQVFETSKLNELQITISGSIVRRYSFDYDTTRFAPSYFQTCPPSPFTGEHKLTALHIKDRNNLSYNFTTTTFAYASRHHAFQVTCPMAGEAQCQGQPDGSTHDVWGYNWKHLTQATNGFGGSVSYVYGEHGTTYTGYHWSRSVVQQETHSGGGGQWDVVTNIAYGAGPDEWDRPDSLYTQNVDQFGSIYLGFAFVDEETGGYHTLHDYFTKGSWNDYVRAGREWQTRWRDAANIEQKKVQTTWAIRTISNYDGPEYYVNFVPPITTDTYTADSISGDLQLHVENTFDAYGNLDTVDNFGDYASQGARVKTHTPYTANTSAWIFVPAYEEKLTPANALLSCIRFYYDGAKTIGAALVRGALTARTTATPLTTAVGCGSASAFSESSSVYTVFDTNGNLLRTSVPTGTSPEGRSESGVYGWIPTGAGAAAYSVSVYDTTHPAFPITQTSPTGLVTSYQYDFGLGKPTQITEPNQHVTHFVYDALGRLTDAYDDGFDTPSYPTVHFVYSWGSSPNMTITEMRSVQNSSTVHRSVSCMDGFGREYEHRENFKGNILNSVKYLWGNRGLVTTKGNPTEASTDWNCIGATSALAARDRQEIAYDTLGNVSRVTYLAANLTSGSYVMTDIKGRTTIKCDERFNTTKEVTNVSASTLTVFDPATTSASCNAGGQTFNATSYQHDLLGRLTSVVDPVQNTTTMSYDLAGRKRSMHDPDMGNWSYTYDATGNLKTQIDARSITTTLTYDNEQRPTGKTYSNGDPAVGFLYDAYPAGSPCADPWSAAGHMTRMTDAGGDEASCFDRRGRAISMKRTVDAVPYTISTAYDPLNQPKQITYPDGEVVSYPEAAEGNITGMTSSLTPTNLVSGATLKAWGAPDTMPLSVIGKTTTYGYDFRMRVTSIATTTHQNLTIGYDDASNVSQTADAIAGVTTTYGYDQLNRVLTGVTGGSTVASYVYNAIGNLTSKTEGVSSRTLTYPASGVSSVRPHAVSSTLPGGGASTAINYDAAGNIASTTGGAASSYGFDAENRLSSRSITTGGAMTYVYDGRGQMLKRRDASGAWTVFVAGLFEKNTTTSAVVKYYALYGQTAMRAGGHVSYLLRDYLGSVYKTVDDTGAATGGQAYWPYGAVRTAATLPTERHFTGQRDESAADSAGLGIYNYGGRFYSSTLGRFVSADPIVGAATDPQSLNAYSSTRNNPLRFIDPSGLDLRCLITCPGVPNQITYDDGYCTFCDALIELQDSGLTYAQASNLAGCGAIQCAEIPVFGSASVRQVPYDGCLGLDCPSGPGLAETAGDALDCFFSCSVANLGPISIAPADVALAFIPVEKLGIAVKGFEAAAGERAVESAARGATTTAAERIAINRAVGKAGEEFVAEGLGAAGYSVEQSVYYSTPFGKRFVGLVIERDGVRIGIEVKTGASRYTATQMRKDAYLLEQGLLSNVYLKRLP